QGSNRFDIDTDLTGIGDREQREVLRVGEIEMNRGSVDVGLQKRFAIRPIHKRYFSRGHMKIFAQDRPQKTSACNVTIAIAFKMEARSALGFVAGEHLRRSLEGSRRDVQVCGPDMHHRLSVRG